MVETSRTPGTAVSGPGLRDQRVVEEEEKEKEEVPVGVVERERDGGAE